MSITLMNYGATSERLRELVTLDVTMAEEEELTSLMRLLSPHDTFTDTYGPESLLAQVGLSWWRDVIPMMDEWRVLSPIACDEVQRAILDAMPPAPIKVIQAMGEGTELSYVVEHYPEANTIRDASVPYTDLESVTLTRRLGELCAFLRRMRSTHDGVLVAP